MNVSVNLEDSLVSVFQLNDKSGPTLTTTVAMPVFSTKNETVSEVLELI